MNKSNKEEIRKNAFAAMDAAAESEIQETGADLIVATEDLQKRIKELEAENKRLRKALEDIAEFADEQYSKRIPAPSCVEFMTIKLRAEKALKGAGE